MHDGDGKQRSLGRQWVWLERQARGAETQVTELIARLDQETRNEFSAELLDALWDAYEAGDLPTQIVLLLRDWTARAHFADSPVVQERLTQAGKGASPT